MENNSNKSEEIDILELSIKLFLFFKRRITIISCFVIIGLAIGVIRFNSSKDYYKTHIIAQSTTVPNDILINIINTFQLLIEAEEYKRLSEELNIDIMAAVNVKVISASLISTSTEGSLFKINIEVFDKSIIDSIRNGLIEYINSQKYIKGRSEIIKEQQLQLISLLNNKIDEVDSLQNVVNTYNKPSIKNNEILLTINENNSFHLELIQLYEKKQNLERQNQLSKEFEIIEDLAPLSIRSTNITSIIIPCFIFFFLGLLCAVLVELKNKIILHLKSTGINTK